MRLVVLALSLTLGLSCGQAALAQTDTAAAQGDVTAREMLVRRYFEAIDFDRMMVGMNDSLLSTMLAQNAALSPEQADIIRESYAEAWEMVGPGYMDQIISLYAEVLSHDELTEMVAFYESDTGRSITAKSVVLTERTGELYESLAERLMPVLFERMCSRMDCPAD